MDESTGPPLTRRPLLFCDVENLSVREGNALHVADDRLEGIV
jgi:hypothetical protein